MQDSLFRKFNKRTVMKSKTLKRRLKSEVAIASKLAHPNLIRFIEIVQDETHFIFVQEKLQMKSLKTLISLTYFNCIPEEHTKRIFT